MSVIIDPNIKKQSVRVDINGNEINPETKEVLVSNAPDYIPTREEIETQINAPKEAPLQPIEANLTITQRIEQTKALLVSLEEERKAEITAKRKELEELEANV